MGDASSVLVTAVDVVSADVDTSCADVLSSSTLAAAEIVGFDVSSSNAGSTTTNSLMSSVEPDASDAVTGPCRVGAGRRVNFFGSCGKEMLAN